VPAYNSGFVLFAPSTFVIKLKHCARGKQTQSRKTLCASLKKKKATALKMFLKNFILK
jgi:hypothetical protein